MPGAQALGPKEEGPMPLRPALVSTALTACMLPLLLSSTCPAANVGVQVPTARVKMPSVALKPTLVVKPTIHHSVALRTNHAGLEGNKSGNSSSPGVAAYGLKAGTPPAGPIASVPIVAGKDPQNQGATKRPVIAGPGILQAGNHAEQVPYSLIRKRRWRRQ
jgi:hypothetical protein